MVGLIEGVLDGDTVLGKIQIPQEVGPVVGEWLGGNESTGVVGGSVPIHVVHSSLIVPQSSHDLRHVPSPQLGLPNRLTILESLWVSSTSKRLSNGKLELELELELEAHSHSLSSEQGDPGTIESLEQIPLPVGELVGFFDGAGVTGAPVTGAFEGA